VEFTSNNSCVTTKMYCRYIGHPVLLCNVATNSVFIASICRACSCESCVSRIDHARAKCSIRSIEIIRYRFFKPSPFLWHSGICYRVRLAIETSVELLCCGQWYIQLIALLVEMLFLKVTTLYLIFCMLCLWLLSVKFALLSHSEFWFLSISGLSVLREVWLNYVYWHCDLVN
jgi:hypothetical protein